MQGRIPEDIIEKIRDEIPIEDAIGHFVALRRKGTSFWGLCPFHTEKTPSFHVHPDRQIFYCFGCGRGGNVFRFLMDREGMAFPEAVQWCASRIGLDLERFLERDTGKADARNRLFDANKWAAEWFRSMLTAPEGAKAREYCLERGLRPETLEEFQVGLAPDDGKRMVAAAKEDKISPETLLQTSLLRRSEGRPPIAYFFGRLIFPVRGVAQKVYGFGGRKLGPGEPKYLNSPETSVFQKRKVLYALPEARAHIIRGRVAILVEGYLDALALHQAGFRAAVATCGTAFTPEQASQLGRFADKVVLLFDGDMAGTKAAFKAADVALTAGIDVAVAELPAGKDPADMVQEGEVDALHTVIQEAPGLVERMHREVAKRGGHRELKERALKHVREILQKVSDPIRAELLQQEAAEMFSVPQSLLRGAPQPRAKSEDTVGPGQDSPRFALERSLLGLAMSNRKCRQLLLASMAPRDFHSAGTRGIFEALCELDDEVEAIHTGHLGNLDDEHERLAARILLEMPDGEFDSVSQLEATLEQLNQYDARDKAREHRQRVDAAYREGGDWQTELRRQRANETE